ncbi:MAG: phosphoribosylformylglycinamidine synthase subunit PurL, partial [Bdellovibrionales bacterium]|nr:phosphoribosylformylglycinamidine synthase subunit PurL [Bdellovibrionales bacterium]
FHGAGKAVGGILRDVFAMNARPIALANYLCFGSPKSSGSRERVNGVVRGIGGYGNCIGIPTITGHTEFSDAYDNNILVNAMAVGLLSSETKVMNSKARGEGNYVVYGGARTGRDGILGASMASESFQDTQDNRPTVQMGDPFYGKQLMEATLSAMEQNLILACQDMGAAGLTCSSFEMAEKGEVGLTLHLDKVPLRDLSMSPEDILLSESQERMLFVCTPSQWKGLKKVFDKYELELVVLGEILKEQKIELYWQEKILANIYPKQWEPPLENRPSISPEPIPRIHPTKFEKEEVLRDILLKILKSPQGRNRRFVYRQYDQRVGVRTVRDSSYPLAVIRLDETKRELAFTTGCRPHLMRVDVREGAKDAVFYPALQLALRGFTPWAVTDCLNFGNPEKPKIMGEFILSVESIASACKALDTPVISGNVSFYNEDSKGRNITSTPALVMVGLKEKTASLPSGGFSGQGEKVYLLRDFQFCFSGLAAQILNKNVQAFGALQDELSQLFVYRILELAQAVSFSSARVVGKFGLLYTLARMVMEKGVGFVSKESFSYPFQERLYEIIVSVPSSEESVFQKQVKTLGLESYSLGETKGEDLQVGNMVCSLNEMNQHYNTSWEDVSL